jgi:hypothetical protein
MARVGIYVQARYAKPSYARESYDARYWPGLEMIRDAVERAGHEVHYCSAANVGTHSVVLASITAACDWWTFIAEQVTWGRRPRVIVGGAGVLNVRPVLFAADVFVFGRGEDIIGPLLAAESHGERLEHESVCYADTFSPDRRYRVAQAERPYPYPVRLSRGGEWSERAIGCQRRCLFCGYTWQRKHVGGAQAESGASNALWGGAREFTFFDLDLARPETWPPALRILGLDGSTERLRLMANKPITREMLRAFLRGWACQTKPRRVRLYNVIGYPTEGGYDLTELYGDARDVDAECPPRDTRCWVEVQNTPFKAFPCTPAAGWPVSYREWRIDSRKRDSRRLLGRALSVQETLTCESLPTQTLDVLIHRGTEDDQDAVCRLARTPAFWSAKTARRRATLESCLDIGRLYRRYACDDLPTRYLDGYVPLRDMMRAGDAAIDREKE